jgi:hypothetical protein
MCIFYPNIFYILKFIFRIKGAYAHEIKSVFPFLLNMLKLYCKIHLIVQIIMSFSDIRLNGVYISHCLIVIDKIQI